MTVKDQVRQLVEELPDDITLDEAIDRLLFLEKINRGLQQADRGEKIPHEEVMKRLDKWLE